MVLKSQRFSADERLQAAAENRPPLRWNSRGEGVVKLQQALIDIGFPMPISTRKFGRPDGIYKRETADKVKEFQRKNGLSVGRTCG